MHIHGLHRNVYRFYRHARTQDCPDAYRQRHAGRVRRWESLKAEGVSDTKCQEFVGISRSACYRCKRVPDNLKKGIAPPSKRQRVSMPRWDGGKAACIASSPRKPRLAKEKIAVIMGRDHGKTTSASTVGLQGLQQNGVER